MAMTTSASTPRQKTTLLSAPISPLAPIYHLPPDPLLPTPDSLLQLSSYDPPENLAENGPVALKIGDPVPPSMLRRSRQVRMGGTFTYTSPLPLQFPYDLDEPGVEPSGPRKASDIERQLRQFEVDPSNPVHDAALDPAPEDSSHKTAYTCGKREASTFPEAKLLSISKKLLNEWLPQLDVGDDQGTEQERKVRQQFIDVVAGKTVLARQGGAGDAEGEKGFAPWAQAYAGHQFGNFAGQLGDGRAISILSTPPTAEVAASTGFRAIELQLKGAGRTPYSRFADGLAVLRSSVREYLGAEAVAALRIPTSRALALVHLPKLHVLRERVETAAIVTRVSGSWLRIGSFELPWMRQEWETLRKLSSYTGRQVFGFESPSGEGPDRSMALSVVREVSRRTALMIAGWQAYGFCHGVMNTDNFALNGATIDFGPYAFMDVFDSGHICNHSDDLGRYAFNKQPTMGVYAIDKLGDALAPLIGKEVELAQEAKGNSGFVEAEHGWTGDEDSEDVNLEQWTKVGKQHVATVKDEFVEHFKTEYSRLMRLKLGLTTEQASDFRLFSTLLDLMEKDELDFTNSFRILSQFTSVKAPSFDRLLDTLLKSDLTAPTASRASTSDRADWTRFFKTYEERLATEGPDAASSRRARMNAHNPRFALRQWVLEETIQKLGDGGEVEGVEQLNRVLDMSQYPFEAYGEQQIDEDESAGACLTAEEMERRRLSGVGSKEMLGFQCSCSS
ncbi:Fmp40p [Sporobolomyces koalae]|uniref:Fmp40p n=1 Tax=Sporobolomyces koalae TaxID=500713 RepID=UPI00316CDC9A